MPTAGRPAAVEAPTAFDQLAEIGRLAARGMAAEEWVALGANLNGSPHRSARSIRTAGEAGRASRPAAEPCIGSTITCSPSCVRPSSRRLVSDLAAQGR